MTADEIIDYYVQTVHSTLTTTNTLSLCPAIFQSWICINIGDKAVIHGQIQNHPQYPSGNPLMTSPIEGYCSDSGHIYVCTDNSMYELGVPRQNLMSEPLHLFSTHEMKSVKLTDWNEAIR